MADPSDEPDAPDSVEEEVPEDVSTSSEDDSGPKGEDVEGTASAESDDEVEGSEDGDKKSVPQEAPKTLLDYLKTRHDPLTGLVLTIPVFLIYHLGILGIDMRNGVDLVSRATFALLEKSVGGYVAVTLGFAVGIFLALWIMRKRGKLRPAKLLPVLIESVVLALLLAGTVGWATGALVPNQIGGKDLNPIEAIIMAAGAGFHEELIFRVILLGGGLWILVKVLAKKGSAVKPWMAFIAMLLVSSLLFSLAHFVGPGSDTFDLTSFAFRALAGVFLGVVYRFRGMAVAVYTHAIYDIFVFFFFW